MRLRQWTPSPRDTESPAQAETTTTTSQTIIIIPVSGTAMLLSEWKVQIPGWRVGRSAFFSNILIGRHWSKCFSFDLFLAMKRKENKKKKKKKKRLDGQQRMKMGGEKEGFIVTIVS